MSFPALNIQRIQFNPASTSNAGHVVGSAGGNFFYASDTDVSLSFAIPAPAVPNDLSGTGPPASSLGSDGDSYTDTAATVVYGPKTAGAWSIAVFSGPATLRLAAGVPANTLGNNNDYYMDTVTHILYQKTAGVWWTPFGGVPNLSGSGAPASSLGVIGNYYADLTASVLYGPKNVSSTPWTATLVAWPSSLLNYTYTYFLRQVGSSTPLITWYFGLAVSGGIGGYTLVMAAETNPAGNTWVFTEDPVASGAPVGSTIALPMVILPLIITQQLYVLNGLGWLIANLPGTYELADNLGNVSAPFDWRMLVTQITSVTV